ncbi:MAG: M1 family metallopeptidase [Candidatus Zixiibacteriota bacterium]|nr:MAG: M1 family metallopeptidase [candidate division Zixibacteria bacterium]
MMKRYSRSNFSQFGIVNFTVRIFILFLTCICYYTANAARDYFQQEVDYNIKADLDPGTAKLACVETIVYKNNSPDTLTEIYFHLFYNAFLPGSYLDLEQRRAGDYSIANLSKRKMGSVKIDLIKIDDLDITDYIIDNTIMIVPLTEPLAPGGTITIYIEFISRIPARGSRTARSGRHFDVGQWYPKPVVYDGYGWHIHQYLDHEFFAEYADFYVELTIPSEYIVAHTGELLNEEEIYGSKLPEPEGDTILVDVLSGFEMKNNGVPDSTVSEPQINDIEEEYLREDTGYDDYEIEDDEETVADTVSPKIELNTWKLKAENIHDFAFCADPEFILDLCKYNDVTIKAYYKKSNKKYWRRSAAEYTRKAIGYFSEKYIPYPYKQYSVVSSLTGGGMEYPQLTMIWRKLGSRGVKDLNFESLISHEVGHAWFYGILGFNETEQSFLDEGLTSFSEISYMEYFYGRRHNNFSYKSGWQKKLLPNGDARNDAQKTYIRRAIIKDEDPMGTPANLFKDGGRYYNASYEKAASVYLMLQYVMGDGKFDIFLDKLVKKWAFKHPYLSDVQEIAEEVHGSSLDWFFRQWFFTTWRLDYALDFVKSRAAYVGGKRGFNTTFSIIKKERCISPLDVVLYFGRDVSDTIFISHDVWRNGQIRYDTTVFLRARPRKVVINPDRRLSDINMLNNSTGIPDIQWQFMVPKFIYGGNYIEHYVESYTVAHRPLLWYNSIDGVKFGYRLDGSYLGVTKNIELEGWAGLNSGKFNYMAGYNNPLFAVSPDLNFYLRSLEIEGRGGQESGLYFVKSNYNVDLAVRRYYVFDPDYIYGDNWSGGDINTVETSFNRRNRFRFTTLNYGATIEASIRGGDYDFSRIFANFDFELLDVFGNNTRFKLKAGMSDGDVPFEKMFFLSSANPVEIWNSPLYRSKGTLPDEWKSRGSLFMPGGGGLYGYFKSGLTGEKILTAKLERDLPQIKIPVYIPILDAQIRRVSGQMYAGSGLVWDDAGEFKPENFLYEAGLTFNYDIPCINKLIDESRVWLFLPIWLSDPSENANKIDWRWIIGFTT